MRLNNLVLNRPLVAIDTETTGLLEQDGRVVEIALCKLDPHGGTSSVVERLDPGVEIPAAATFIHGITDADVRRCGRWCDLWPLLVHHATGADVCGFNLLGFDLEIIRRECDRAGLDAGALFRGRALIDPMAIFHHAVWGGEYPPRGRGTLRAAVRHYLGREHVGAHGAEADARAALEVLDAQVAAHDLPREVAALDQYPFQPADLFPAPREPEPEPVKLTQGRLLEELPSYRGAYGRDQP